MSKTDEVRKAMMQAMKDGDKDRKNALSMLLAALKQKQIDKRENLTPEEEKFYFSLNYSLSGLLNTQFLYLH